MEFAKFQPIVNGFLGGLIAAALGVWWARWLPRSRSGKGSDILRAQNRVGIWLSNGAFIAGILGGIAMYRWGGFASDDWRPMTLGAGISLCAPLVILPVAALLRGDSPFEAYIAFAISQRTPLVVLYPLLALGVPLLTLALINL